MVAVTRKSRGFVWGPKSTMPFFFEGGRKMKHEKGLFGITVNKIGIEKYIDPKNDDHIVVKIENQNGKTFGEKEFFSYDDYSNWIDNIHDDFGNGVYCHYQDGALIKRACDNITGESWFS